MMKIGDIYPGLVTPDTQAVSQPASAAKSTAPTAPAPAATNHVAISWIGLVIALILLRIIYELSD